MSFRPVDIEKYVIRGLLISSAASWVGYMAVSEAQKSYDITRAAIEKKWDEAYFDPKQIDQNHDSYISGQELIDFASQIEANKQDEIDKKTNSSLDFLEEITPQVGFLAGAAAGVLVLRRKIIGLSDDES